MIKILIRFIAILPHKFALALGNFLGRLAWLVAWKKVDTCEKRCVLALGVGITIARKIILNSFVNIGRDAVEFAKLEKINTPEKIKSVVEFPDECIKILHDAQSRGHGVILLTAHIGNFELAAARITREGFNLYPIYTPQSNNFINDLIQERRANSIKNDAIKSDGLALRGIFEVLKNNNLVSVMHDLDARSDGIVMPFLNMPASVHKGIIKIHNITKAPIVPAFSYRDKNNPAKHKIFIGEIISDAPDFGKNLKSSLELCNKIIEGFIKQFPEQWFWIMDKWQYTERKKILTPSL